MVSFKQFCQTDGQLYAIKTTLNNIQLILKISKYYLILRQYLVPVPLFTARTGSFSWLSKYFYFDVVLSRWLLMEFAFSCYCTEPFLRISVEYRGWKLCSRLRKSVIFFCIVITITGGLYNNNIHRLYVIILCSHFSEKHFSFFL